MESPLQGSTDVSTCVYFNCSITITKKIYLHKVYLCNNLGGCHNYFQWYLKLTRLLKLFSSLQKRLFHQFHHHLCHLAPAGVPSQCTYEDPRPTPKSAAESLTAGPPRPPRPRRPGTEGKATRPSRPPLRLPPSPLQLHPETSLWPSHTRPKYAPCTHDVRHPMTPTGRVLAMTLSSDDDLNTPMPGIWTPSTTSPRLNQDELRKRRPTRPSRSHRRQNECRDLKWAPAAETLWLKCAT